MVYKHKTNIFYAIIMAIVMLLTIVSTTIASATISDSNSITFHDSSEEKEKTANANESMFILFFGFVTVNAVIEDGGFYDNSYQYICEPVEKVTVIGFGSYVYDNDTFHTHFYVKSFTNVSVLGCITYKKLEVSAEYQNFSLFVTHRYVCALIF